MAMGPPSTHDLCPAATFGSFIASPPPGEPMGIFLVSTNIAPKKKRASADEEALAELQQEKEEEQQKEEILQVAR